MVDLPCHLTHETTAIYGPISVFLNGVEVHDVCEAHTGEGWLIRGKRDELGGIIVEGDEFATEKMFGIVTAGVSK